MCRIWDSMKRVKVFLIAISFFVLIASILRSQDIIVFKNGDEVKAKISITNLFHSKKWIDTSNQGFGRPTSFFELSSGWQKSTK